jgi:hypothetical protein
MKEKSTEIPTITISEITFQIMEQINDYCHFRSFDVKEYMIIDLLLAADYFHIHSLFDVLWEQFLEILPQNLHLLSPFSNKP